MSLVNNLASYTEWRGEVTAAIEDLRQWLQRSDVGDAQTDLRLRYVLERLRDDHLTIAFVAEFSRGKSELINAIFFSDLGDRVLPSSSGRTTMCPTELSWHEGARPEIRLLSIESRRDNRTVSELRREVARWVAYPLDPRNIQSLQSALARVGEVVRVSQDQASELGFSVDMTGLEGLKPGPDGLVEVPRWRHALISFPHPLLAQGLVVLDTPGLNAIGAEPELTLSLLPNAHAVLFVLAADTGVTQSDMTVWRDFVRNGRKSGRGELVVLNKIDGLWDGLRDEERISFEINRQIHQVASTLDVPSSHIHPVSAQKALVGRVAGDQALVKRSRIDELERALAEDVLPLKYEIVRDNTLMEVDELVDQTRGLLKARLNGLQDQVRELGDLRGKNQGVIEYMMRKVRMEKSEFEQGLQKYYAVRSVFSTLTNNLLAHLGLDALREEAKRTREAMDAATFTKGLKSAMEGFFLHMRENLARSTRDVTEITTMLDTMYKRFSVEHGLKLNRPESFSTQRYERELDRLESAFNRQINTALTLLTTEKHALTQRFFETVAQEAHRTFEGANRDVDQWLRAVMAPLETQVREYQLQLKRRLESIKRIHEATDTLDERLEELRLSEKAVLAQLATLDDLKVAIRETFVKAGFDLPQGQKQPKGAGRAA